MSRIFLDQTDVCSEVGALTLGNFDGLHLGHKDLIEKTKSLATLEGKPSALMTFDPHPSEVLGNEGFKRIYPIEQNYEIIEKLGVEHIFIKSFSLDFSRKRPLDFLEEIHQKIKFSHLVVGFDFRFGARRQGDFLFLQKWAQEKNIQVFEVKKKKYQDHKISSTRIKRALSEGEVGLAQDLLGEEFFLKGSSSPDQGLGRRIGFPTVNIKLPQNLALKKGVYLTDLKWGEKRLKAISNFGQRPTLDQEPEKLTLETHILQNQDQIKNINFGAQKICVYFSDFLREEQKFSSLDELKGQISRDVQKAKEIYSLK